MIVDRLNAVHQRIENARSKYLEKDHIVTLLAVSKTKPITMIVEAIEAGQLDFGENYVQEAVEKMDSSELKPLRDKISWHFIGRVQSNKTKEIAEHFDWVHTLDRLKIAQRLHDQRPSSLSPLKVCIQVNFDDEINKAGVAPHEVLEFAKQIQKLPNLQLQGLMMLPKQLESGDFAAQYQSFLRLKHLQTELHFQGIDLPHLSMGMSQDLEAAIAAGASIVRVGRDIFGARG